MPLKKKILIAVLTIFVLIQFFRPTKNQTPGKFPNDIFAHYQAPDSLKQLIETSCYDCHSNHTKYPWYDNIQPVSWWLDNHIDEGKKELNFNEFATYSKKKANRKLDKLIDEIKEKEMPLKSYTFIHANALLNASQREAIVLWAENIQTQIK